MKLAVFSPVFGDLSLAEALDFLAERGVHSMELGCGGYPGTAHVDAKELIKDKKKADEVLKLFKEKNVDICALSVHGNCVHPSSEIAAKFQEDFEAACKLAKLWGKKKIITFSGCPGDSVSSIRPNWVTCAWPNDFAEILEYQWNDVLIPYWKKAAGFAKECGVEKIALELHPGFCCYNPETLLKLRAAVGDIIGANFDPSHLIWQGIDPVLAIKELGKAIYHFHAKDTYIDKFNTAKNGVLETKPFTNEMERSWIFRTVGYGSDELMWRTMLSTLNLIGYSDAISIEHEDSLIVGLEGLEKAIEFLKEIMPIAARPAKLWWA